MQAIFTENARTHAYTFGQVECRRRAIRIAQQAIPFEALDGYDRLVQGMHSCGAGDSDHALALNAATNPRVLAAGTAMGHP